ncbi:unnamed protein product [Allacma fusca]|uniref:Uncharacterized protein n=1 Tax=Allacma fusca TaxID=39272 RepID=A0A8J2L0Y5_9HEXA|nr:unnamed protein product [Allacma fusca]
MTISQDLEDDKSVNSLWDLQLKNNWKAVEEATKWNITPTKIPHLRGEQILHRKNVEVTSEPVLAIQPSYLNGILIGVTVMSGIIFVLVAALLLYVVFHAKRSSKDSQDDEEEDDVFEEDVIINARKRRSIPIIRFDVPSDSDGEQSA